MRQGEPGSLLLTGARLGIQAPTLQASQTLAELDALDKGSLAPFLGVVAGAVVAVVCAPCRLSLPRVIGRGINQGKDDIGRFGKAQAVLDAVSGLATVGNKAVGEAEAGAFGHLVQLTRLKACHQRLDTLGGVRAGLAKAKVVNAIFVPEQGYSWGDMVSKKVSIRNIKIVLVNFGYRDLTLDFFYILRKPFYCLSGRFCIFPSIKLF